MYLNRHWPRPLRNVRLLDVLEQTLFSRARGVFVPIDSANIPIPSLASDIIRVNHHIQGIVCFETRSLVTILPLKGPSKG